MSKSSIWVPADAAAERALTSATLEEETGSPDHLTLFVQGELATRFPVAEGAGASVLAECGLVKVERRS